MCVWNDNIPYNLNSYTFYVMKIWSVSWKLLEHIHTQLELPWVVFGDFNEITHANEKCGWAKRSADQMIAFKNALDFYDPQDMGFSGRTTRGATEDLETNER